MLTDKANPKEKVDVAHDLYADDWQENAQNFAVQSCYIWMVEQLKPFNPRSILDIGCGNGQGLLALKQAFPKAQIIAIDENSKCLSRAKDLLAENNYDSDLVERLEFAPAGPNRYKTQLAPGNIKISADITLVEADILLDDGELEASLLDLDELDSVTIWLVGTHLLRWECDDLSHLTISNAGDYRLHVQNRVYRLADQLLKPGGVLQVVDRGEPPRGNDLREDCLSSHSEQARLTSMEVKHLDSRVYDELAGGKRIEMEDSLGSSGRRRESSDLAITSVISLKGNPKP